MSVGCRNFGGGARSKDSVRLAPSARLVLVLGTAAAALAMPSAAQSPAPVLHRPIPGDLSIEDRDDARPLLPPATGASVSQAAGAANPWRDHQPTDEAITHPRASWETPMRELDRDTRSPAGASLRYTEVFTPSITPFKRMQSYDTVDDFGRLTVRDPSLRAVDTGEGPAPSRWNHQPTARFVGDVNVEVSPEWPTPIPSVAGDQRVVSYTTSSGHALEFVQDGAGNLFARGTARETVRLGYVLEAPQSAFAAPSVPGEMLDRARLEVPIGARPNVPVWLQAHADEVLRAAGVNANQPLGVVVAGLVAYFRSFRDADLPEAGTGQNLYADLALNRVGACRHRAYAFVLTLHALGLEARYVGNEAHAWAEVNFRAGSGWSRIDLGGWDIPLDAQAPTDRPQFRPANDDPFPRPANFDAQYSSRAAAQSETRAGEPTNSGGGSGSGTGGSGAMPDDGQNGTGGAGDPVSGAQQSSTGTGASGAGTATSASGTSTGTGAASTAGGAGTANTSAGGARAVMPSLLRPGASARGGDPDADEEEPLGTVLAVSGLEADHRAGYAAGVNSFVRGSMVTVRGEVHDANGAAVGGLAIEIQLVREHRVVGAIGRTVSQPDGHWEAHAQLPFDLATGEYTLRAGTNGDHDHAAASAE